jgi:hypothetical protein
MNDHDIKQILSWLLTNKDGSYSKRQVLEAIKYAYDIGFTEGRDYQLSYITKRS